jgi:hypothetical protein
MMSVVLVCAACAVSPGKSEVATAQPRASADYTSKPPLSAGEFWGKMLTLLNENNSSVTKDRLEQVLGVRFPAPEHLGIWEELALPPSVRVPPHSSHPYTRALWACRPSGRTYGTVLPVMQ